MNPHICLTIKNYTPVIYFKPDEGMSRRMTQKEESILENILKTASELNIEVDEDRKAAFDQLLSLAREADELFLDEYSKIDLDTIEFNIEELFSEMVEQSKSIEDEYEEVDMNEEVRDTIKLNKSSDIFASIMESLYLRLIAKTVLAASELGIGEIHLNDEHGNARLAEKMAKELDRLGMTFVIDEE